MIYIYSPHITARLIHSFSLIFNSILKLELKFTDDLNEWNSFTGVKISYAGKSLITDNLNFEASNLLFETGIKSQNIIVGQYQGMPTLFPVEGGVLPFDPFAAAFFLTSRYEEYNSVNRDRHGRYAPENSIAYKHKFLSIPVVNYYALIIKDIIISHYPAFIFPQYQYKFIPTIDIDTAYAYKYRSILHQVGGLVKNVFKLDFSEVLNRLKVHAGREMDPYDSYQKQDIIHKKYDVSPIYFVLMGNRGKYDRNLSYNGSGNKELFKHLKAKNLIGLHPSYESNECSEMFEIEKNRLEEISGQKITKSRQHYLKLEIPFTYQKLIKENISDDYTMGYASKIGFRASICSPFYFYDLTLEMQTDLLIHPFFAMDTTLKKYMKMKSTDVLEKLKPLFEHVKFTNGEAIVIFHNESIGGKFKHWKRWGNMYELVIQMGFNNK